MVDHLVPPVETLEGLGCVLLPGRADDPEFAAAVRRTFGVEPPVGPLTSARHGAWTVLWLGPDRFLASGPDEEVAERLGGLAIAYDVSDAYTVFRLSGALAREVLMRAGTLDFHPRAFAVGKVVRGGFARTTAIYHLVAEAPPVFDLYVDRSYAVYVLKLMTISLQNL